MDAVMVMDAAMLTDAAPMDMAVVAMSLPGATLAMVERAVTSVAEPAVTSAVDV
jgi:hypothetical protein